MSYGEIARPPVGIDDAKGVRRTATGILGALLVVFVATSVPETPSQWVLLIRAMAEAGMIGGLADWFAVEALFRRPLRLPIPHTALLPSNQKRAAENIARFIDEYFLDADLLLRQIQDVDPLRQSHRLAEPAGKCRVHRSRIVLGNANSSASSDQGRCAAASTRHHLGCASKGGEF